ncbi:MAG: glycosyltransferase [Vallitalea sp.]|jgi:glycosyltransferase involved in cell wall biosynthesis|nr:glycosyltransferase [Vallitalea sp.]
MKIGFSRKPIGKGGAITWIKTFSDFCVSKGHKVYFSYKDNIDVFCSVANYSKPEELKYLKDHNIKILQRLGAIFLDYNYDDQRIIKDGNEHLKQLIKYADCIVYQSNFSKKELFGSLYNGKEPDGHIIYNSTNTTSFNPQVPLKSSKNKKIILSTAYWGASNTAFKSVNLLIEVAKLLKNNKDIEFWLLGLAPKEVHDFAVNAKLPNITKINLLKPIDYSSMPNYLQDSDLILHLKAHEGCSNMVIETMHTGTPLVGLNSGSLPELLGDAALLADCSSDIHTFPNVNIEDLKKKILLTLEQQDVYRNKMISRSNLYSEKTQYTKYLSLLHDLYKNHQ